MIEKQFYFEIKEIGANLDIEHNVYNIIFLFDLFQEFYPNEFNNKQKQEHSRVKNPKEILTFILWAKSNKKKLS